MKESFVSSADLSELLQRLNDSDFIVNVNNTAHQSIWSERISQVVRVDQPSDSFNRQICDVKAFIFESTTGIEDTFVINLSRDNMLFLIAIELGDTF